MSDLIPELEECALPPEAWVYIANQRRTIESLQREIDAQKVFEASWMKQRADLQRENEELKARPTNNEFYALKLTVEKQSERIRELSDAAITPEMREVLKRAFALAREVEESELAEDLCGLLIESDPYRNPHLNTGDRDLLGGQG